MLLQLENMPPVSSPSLKEMSRLLRRMRSYGPSSYALLVDEPLGYVQVAGGGIGCVLERRLSAVGRVERAYLQNPVAVFEDGTKLPCSAGLIVLLRDEWHTMDQVIEVFASFLTGDPFPSWTSWRDMSDRLRST
jgi:hypothetical protein